MAEDSFIILDTTPSLMEPYSFLEMPDSLSLQPYSANETAPQQKRNHESVPAVNSTNVGPAENMAAMKSLWSTKLAAPQLNSACISTGTQIEEAADVAGASDATTNVSSATQTNISPHAELSDTVENSDGVVRKLVDTSMESAKGASIDSTKKTMTPLSTTPKDKLAESFLMGDIDYETMKSNVISHFPSLISSIDIASESSHMETDGIQDVWLSNVEAIKEAPIREVKKCQNKIEELNNQNIDLQEKIVELQRLVENQHIAQMAESHTDATDRPETIVSDPTSDAIIAEMKSKYEQQIQTMQFELSKAIGENLEIEDIKKVYVDELDCLKVNLVATEELYKESVAQQNILKSRNAFLSQEINDNKRQMIKMQDEIDLLKAQLEEYKKDFEIEKNSHQEIVTEREQVLSDMQLLQRRNRELLDVVGNSVSAAAARDDRTFLGAQDFPEYTCPLCTNAFRNYETLERHVDRCLDRSESERCD